MRAILAVFRAILRAERAAFLRGAALAVCVAAMGAALLGLSGWFIVAAGAEGLALGLDAVAAGTLDPARAAIGPFVALALAETLAPLRRATPALWPEQALRGVVVLVPQRPALMRGTLREALRLADPDAPDETLRAALEAVALWPAVAARGGLDLALGDRGAGLSGSEQRRLALARALLRRPAVMLLDEPTEGLDGPTAARVLDGLRAALPDAAFLVAAHRPAEIAWAARTLATG